MKSRSQRQSLNKLDKSAAPLRARKFPPPPPLIYHAGFDLLVADYIEGSLYSFYWIGNPNWPIELTYTAETVDYGKIRKVLKKYERGN